LRVLLAGDTPFLQRALAELRTYDTEVLMVDHVHTEGELFRALRAHQPDVLIIDDTVRPDAAAAWYEYLQVLSEHTRLIPIKSCYESTENDERT